MLLLLLLLCHHTSQQEQVTHHDFTDTLLLTTSFQLSPPCCFKVKYIQFVFIKLIDLQRELLKLVSTPKILSH